MEPTPGRSDSWPHTGRLMPWLVAVFLGMIFLVPFDSLRLPVPLPVDSALDRFLLPLMALVWICGALAMRRAVNPLPRTWISFAIGFFVAIALTSVLINAGSLQTSGDLQVGWKGLATLISYIAFFFLVATTIRQSELRSFGNLIVVLACITAAGTVLEYRTGVNIFRDVTEKLAVGGATLAPPPPRSAADVASRPEIIGPARHGLAVCTMMAFALPIAIERAFRSLGLRRIMWLLAMGLIVAGGVATLRKTALVLPLAVVLVIVAYRPRQTLRVILPTAVALVVLVQLLAPGAIGKLAGELSPSHFDNNTSTQGRISDYEAVRPDILYHPLLGRGFGTYLPSENRFVDNEYIVTTITTGIIGVVAYLLMVVAVMTVAHRSIKARDPALSGVALAASAGAFAYGIAGFLFDEFGFPQAPFLFFFTAAVVAVAATSDKSAVPARYRLLNRAVIPSTPTP